MFTFFSINKPGGCAKITKIHKTEDGNYIEGLDVKYLVGGGFERNVDPCIVSPFETLDRGGRKRRGRDFLFEREKDLQKKNQEDEEEEQQQQEEKSKRNMNDHECDVSDTDDRDGGVSAAAKESSSSRQSITTYSTPQKKRNKAASKPKKVTPIPKMVKIGTNAIDSISPMTEDRPTTTSSQNNKREENSAMMLPPAASQTHRRSSSSPSPGVARRGGLFSDVDLDNDRQQQTATTNMKKTMKDKSTGLSRRGDGEENNNNSTSMMDRKPAAKPKSNVASKTIGAGTGGLRLKSNIGTSIMGVSKKTSKPSFSRTTSAYAASAAGATTSSTNDDLDCNIPGSSSKMAASATAARAAVTTSTPSINRKPLLDVYREEVKKARDFMDKMVGPSNANDDDLVGGNSDITNSNKSKRFIRTTS